MNEEISALVATLHDTQQRLEALTEGEVDTVVDRDGRTFLLRRAQEHLRDSEAAKQAAILNALPAQIALLDPWGLIVAVNDSWRFASPNTIQSPGHAIGLNYVEICESAPANGASDARQITAGIRSVLSAEAKSFSFEYPSHSPSKQHWCQLTVTPLADDRRNGVVVMHVDITERKRAEEEQLAVQSKLAESEQRLRTIIDTEPECVKVVSRDMVLLDMNAAGLAMLEADSLAEVQARPLVDFVVPEYRAAFADLHARVMRGESGFVEFQVIGLKDGRRWLETHAAPMGGEHGKATTLLGITRDITERKQTVDALRESERRFSDMLANVEMVAVMLDTQARVTYCNDHLLRLTGRQREDVIGGDWLALFMPPEAESARDRVASILAGKPGFAHTENLIVTRAGERRMIRWSHSVLRSGAGEVIGMASIGEDITERRAAQAEQLEASRQRGMAEVATNILHNVGNVLNSVNVSASLVAEKIKASPAAGMARVAALLREHEADLGSYISSDPKGRHVPAFLQQLARDWQGQQEVVLTELESLRANIDHIKGIVAVQQSHAKASGTVELVDVKELVEHSLRLNEGSLHKHQVRVVREFADVPQVSTEKHKALQILVNLVRNAKQACDGLQPAQKCITLRIAQADGRVRITVSDNGAGIAPENLTSIFSHGFTTRKDGHGFGLHSGALAATELGGSLSVHSEGVGKGATFTLEFAPPPAVTA